MEEKSEVKETEESGAAEPSETVAAKENESTVAEVPVKEGKKDLFIRFMMHGVLPILFSGILRAFAIYIFVTPNNFAPGGTNGIAVILEYLTGLNSGYYLLIISVPLFFLAFFFIGKKEAVLSTLSFFVSSVVLILFNLIEGAVGVEHLLPTYGGGDSGVEGIVHGLLGAVAGGIFLGIALALMLKQCGTSGGTTILAIIINQKFRNLSVGMLTSAFDAIVVFASIFVYGGDNFTSLLDPVLLALVSLFVTSKVCDSIMHGFKTAYKFEIVTNDPEALAQEIMAKLHHGVTKISAEGMYKHEGRSMLVCIIRKRQVAVLQKIIRSYPDTFAYFSPTSEVYGKFAK